VNKLISKYMRFYLTLLIAGAISQASYAHLPAYEGERVRNDNHSTQEGGAITKGDVAAKGSMTTAMIGTVENPDAGN